MSHHAFVTFVIPFDDTDGHLARAVNDLLDVCADSNTPPGSAFRRILDGCGFIHFLTITAVGPICPSEEEEPDDPRRREKSHLLIEVSSDRGTEEVVDLLAGQLQPQITQILHAVGVHPAGCLHSFLRRHAVRIDARKVRPWNRRLALGQVHAGSPGMTVERVRAERDLAHAIGQELKSLRSQAKWGNASPRGRLDQVREWLWTSGLRGHGSKWVFAAEPAPLLAAGPDPTPSFRNPNFRQAVLDVVVTFLKCALWVSGAVLLVDLWLVFSLGNVRLALVWTAFSALVMAGALAYAVYRGYRLLRRRETIDPVEDETPKADAVRDIMLHENHTGAVQNHLASVSRIKPGRLRIPYIPRFRHIVLRLAFIVVGAGRFVCAPGFLGKNGVIHFARWMRIPRTDQLLFWSNYSGTWPSYVGDFIADSPSGVTAIWSNCVGFPRSESLFSKGAATDRDRLVRWARRQQHPTRFWYSAYPDLTPARIRINAAIRQGISSAQTDADARDWLALFGSAPKPAEQLDIPEIPTLVFGGLSNLTHCACYFVTLRENSPRWVSWLERVAREATYGTQDPGQQTAVVIGLACSGLAKLGLPDEALATFPVAFQQGMWPEWRARALGDLGPNAPAKWEWGTPEWRARTPGPAAPAQLSAPQTPRPTDAVVLIYARQRWQIRFLQKELFRDEKGWLPFRKLTLKPLQPKPRVKASSARRTAAASQAPAHPSATTQQPGVRSLPSEPFGFADGVSQPVIRGAPRWNQHHDENHVVEPGEMILGYPDNLKVISPTPWIAAEHDGEHLLSDIGTDAFRKRPELSLFEATGRRDLGLNGTFLVVRQLQQQVREFELWQARTMRRLRVQGSHISIALGPRSVKVRAGTRPRAAIANSAQQVTRGPIWKHEERERIKEFLAAKLVGRWKDGTSLLRYPVRPGSQEDPPAPADNDFLHGVEDPTGMACPFGAHVRRANPRDTRFAKSKEEIATVNRHRILRVGRAYEKGPVAKNGRGRTSERGLLFMCLNADIERQFEFIQKTWLLNPNMHGLENEVDPIIGTGPRKLTVPTETGPVELDIDQDFVRTLGGGYFFLPSRLVLRYIAFGLARNVAAAPSRPGAALSFRQSPPSA
jgi:deferrochelatase/peroxidase EfeB